MVTSAENIGWSMHDMFTLAGQKELLFALLPVDPGSNPTRTQAKM